MADMMNFPKRWEDFLHDYEFEDARRIYTNGSRLIPSFRVKQMMEHYAPVRHGRWIDKGGYAVCMECGGRSGIQYDGVEPIPLMTQFCPNCGAKMDGGADWMDVREKLVELLKGAPYNSFGNKLGESYFNSCLGLIADHLIANGVTVQEWISVKDRLPDNKEHDWVLAQVVEDNGYMHIPKVMEYRQLRNDWFEETYGWLSEHNGLFSVTHWMPLPQPPKDVKK